MLLQSGELEGGIRLVRLQGRLDALGTDSVEIRFVSCCSGEKVRLLVDLSQVNYISSIGIPLLINAARAIARQGGTMALLKPQKAVKEILELTGIGAIIPIYDDLKAATAGLCTPKEV